MITPNYGKRFSIFFFGFFFFCFSVFSFFLIFPTTIKRGPSVPNIILSFLLGFHASLLPAFLSSSLTPLSDSLSHRLKFSDFCSRFSNSQIILGFFVFWVPTQSRLSQVIKNFKLEGNFLFETVPFWNFCEHSVFFILCSLFLGFQIEDNFIFGFQGFVLFCFYSKLNVEKWVCEIEIWVS